MIESAAHIKLSVNTTDFIDKLRDALFLSYSKSLTTSRLFRQNRHNLINYLSTVYLALDATQQMSLLAYKRYTLCVQILLVHTERSVLKNGWRIYLLASGGLRVD